MSKLPTNAKDEAQIRDETYTETTVKGWFDAPEDDGCLPPLSRTQRIVAFFGCLVLGATCLALASLYTPVLMLKARKFALLFTFGSLLILVSLSMLHGPAAYMQYMISKEKLPFTAAYGLTVVATLYTSMVMRSTVYTIPTAAAQLATLTFFVISYVPGGVTGLKLLGKFWWMWMKNVVWPAVKYCIPF